MTAIRSGLMFVGLALAGSIALGAGGIGYVVNKRLKELRPKSPMDFLQVASAAYKASPSKARKSLRRATQICIEEEVGPVPSFYIEYTRDSLLPLIRFFAEGGRRTFRAEKKLRLDMKAQSSKHGKIMFKKLRVHPKAIRANIRQFDRYIGSSPEPFFECIDANFPPNKRTG